jgi:hypothetical protein
VAIRPDLVAGAGALRDHFTSAYARRWETFTASRTGRADATIATLGPPGTSSHLAALLLAESYAVGVDLFADFDDVLAALLDRRVRYALIPSAYRGSTKFHWHGELRLETYFARATPDYGIASRTGALPPGAGPITVAAMWEVRPIYHEVVPAAARERDVRWVDAVSTQHAAEIVTAGGAEAAVTNEPGTTAHELRWVARRPGAEIIWMLFSRR